MHESKLIKCYGCQAEVKNMNGPKHAYIGSDAGCWDVFCNVLAKEYMEYNELWKTHGLTVDTYAAQHPGHPARKEIQSVFLHLTRLYLQLEKGLRAKEANIAMKNILKHKDQYAWLDPLPDFKGTINVLDVAKAKDINEHKELIEKWGWSVWNAWSEHHSTIKYFVEKNNIMNLYEKEIKYGK